MNFRKYLVLAGVTVFASAGDSLLSHGMKQIGNISLHHLQSVIFALANPWVVAGILLLLAFFASYATALSWADLLTFCPRRLWDMCCWRWWPGLPCMSMSARYAGRGLR